MYTKIETKCTCWTLIGSTDVCNYCEIKAKKNKCY